MGKNKGKRLEKKNNPIYKKVTSKTQTKAKGKTQPVKKPVQVRYEFSCYLFCELQFLTPLDIFFCNLH